jgi:hypothetical protein
MSQSCLCYDWTCPCLSALPPRSDETKPEIGSAHRKNRTYIKCEKALHKKIPENLRAFRRQVQSSSDIHVRSDECAFFLTGPCHGKPTHPEDEDRLASSAKISFPRTRQSMILFFESCAVPKWRCTSRIREDIFSHGSTEKVFMADLPHETRNTRYLKQELKPDPFVIPGSLWHPGLGNQSRYPISSISRSFGTMMAPAYFSCASFT